MRTLTVLLPPLARLRAADQALSLARWLAKGDRLPAAATGRDAALRTCFEFIGKDVPHAALTRLLDGDDVDGDDVAGYSWLRADPAHVVADAVTLRMLACGNLDLSAEESEELARPLRLLFGDAGFPLEAAHPRRWYLRCPRSARLPRFAAPETALGDDLAGHLPQGDNERQWRHLLNEAQVILHNHPVNARRAQRGQMPANSVWFWGAGVLPDWARSEFGHVLSRDETALGLARLANVAVLAPDPGWEVNSDGAILFDLADVRDGEALERDFLKTLQAALSRREFGEILVAFEDGTRSRIKPGHRWRFWRRIRALPAR